MMKRLNSLNPCDLDVSKLSPELIASSFNCDDDALNEFLSKSAYEYEKRNFNKIYVIHFRNKILAYCAVFCSHLELRPEVLEEAKIDIPIPHSDFRVSGVCIGRMGVQKELWKKGLGKKLINYVIPIARQISRTCGCRILWVDAYDKSVDFYEHVEFQLYQKKHDKNKMIFDLFKDSESKV